MTIFNKYYMIDIRQGGEWLWRKVLNTHNSLKKMRFDTERIIPNWHFVKQLKILESVSQHSKTGWKQRRKMKGLSTRGSGNYASDEAKEIARLQRELRDTKDALEVLKKAISILGKWQKPSTQLHQSMWKKSMPCLWNVRFLSAGYWKIRCFTIRLPKEKIRKIYNASHQNLKNIFDEDMCSNWVFNEIFGIVFSSA